jgi:hypothetical protein
MLSFSAVGSLQSCCKQAPSPAEAALSLRHHDHQVCVQPLPGNFNTAAAHPGLMLLLLLPNIVESTCAMYHR